MILLEVRARPRTLEHGQLCTHRPIDNGESSIIADESVLVSTAPPNVVNNHEVQNYSTSPRNVSLSGGSGALLIRPQRDEITGAWTSGRLECNNSFACPPGKAMIMQARLCAGYAPVSRQAGIWPAFWALGQSIREGVPWPGCGETDIYEAAGGQPWTIATIHFSDTGNTNHYMLGGIGAAQAAVSFTSSVGERAGTPVFHTFALTIDRRITPETMSFSIDNSAPFYTIASSQLSPQQWDILAHQPIFPILNVAVGTVIPVPDPQPNQDTGTGLSVGMQVNYVAVYYSM